MEIRITDGELHPVMVYNISFLFIFFTIYSVGGVKVVFVNLDPADPNRIFFVILDVVDDKVWNSKCMSIV